MKAVNDFGVGSPSSRLVFRTSSKHQEILEDIFDEDDGGHDMTQCCHNVGVSEPCQQLCSFNLASDLLTNLTSQCVSDMDKILRYAKKIFLRKYFMKFFPVAEPEVVTTCRVVGDEACLRHVPRCVRP